MPHYFFPHYYQNSFWFFGLIPLVINLLFWGVLVWAIVSLLGFRSHPEPKSGEEERNDHPNRYLEIVKERYAKGEINKREYDALRKELS